MHDCKLWIEFQLNLNDLIDGTHVGCAYHHKSWQWRCGSDFIQALHARKTHQHIVIVLTNEGKYASLLRSEGVPVFHWIKAKWR